MIKSQKLNKQKNCTTVLTTLKHSFFRNVKKHFVVDRSYLYVFIFKYILNGNTKKITSGNEQLNAEYLMIFFYI